MRFVLSVIILTLLITYAIIPAIKYLGKFVKSESKRADNAFNDKKTNDEKENAK